jgi:hypothetical protein
MPALSCRGNTSACLEVMAARASDRLASQPAPILPLLTLLRHLAAAQWPEGALLAVCRGLIATGPAMEAVSRVGAAVEGGRAVAAAPGLAEGQALRDSSGSQPAAGAKDLQDAPGLAAGLPAVLPDDPLRAPERLAQARTGM